MSNKKWRRPSNPDYQPPVVEPEQDEQQREQYDPARPEVAAKVEAAVPQVAAPAAMHQPMPQFDLNVSDDEAQGFINEMTRFLAGIVRSTNVVLANVSFAGFESAVAADLPKAGAEPVADKIEQAQKTLPRSHPLLGLIRFALASTRLLNRILVTTKPHLFGLPSIAFKSIMHAAKASKQFLDGNVPSEAMRDAMGHSGLV